MSSQKKRRKKSVPGAIGGGGGVQMEDRAGRVQKNGRSVTTEEKQSQHKGLKKRKKDTCHHDRGGEHSEKRRAGLREKKFDRGADENPKKQPVP